MKNIVQTSLPLGMIQTVLILAFFLSIPFSLLSQEDDKEKKVTVKIIKEVDGKKIVRDTTFIVSGDDDVKKIVRQYTADSEGDTSADVMVDVTVDVDSEHKTVDGKKVVIIKKRHHGGDADVRIEKKIIIIDGDGSEEHVMVYPHGGHKKVMKFKTDDGEEDIIILSPRSHTKVMQWTDEDGEDFEFNYEFDMENLEKEMAELDAGMKEIQIMMIDEEGRMHDRFIEMEHLSEFDNLEEFEHFDDMDVIVMPPRYRFPPNDRGGFTWHKKGRMAVTDEELRDAGIKNKPDRLELDEININNEDGVIDLSFSLKEEGTPKVTVYNVYGDKVFTGKPELMNNKYQVKMDLSKKQHGNYYLMIVSGNTSKTMRLKI